MTGLFLKSGKLRHSEDHGRDGHHVRGRFSKNSGASRVAQWLRIRLPTQEHRFDFRSRDSPPAAEQ